MVKDIFNFIMIAGIVLGVVFMIFSLRSKNGSDKTVIFLNLVVLFLTLNNLQLCLFDNGYLDVNFFVRKMLIPWYMLILPSFYTFLTYYLKVENRIFSFVRFSVVLFIIEILVRIAMIPFFFHDNENYTVAKYSQIEEIFNAVYTIFLFVKSGVLVFSYANRFNFVSSFDNLRWLKHFIFLGCLVMLLWVCAILINLDNVVYPEIYVYYPMRLSCSIVLYWIAYSGFFNYKIMTERIALREKITVLDSSPAVVCESETHTFESKKMMQEKFIEIENFMKNNDDYLKADFSLQKLSFITGIPVNKLSNIINSCALYNFSDYVNRYRVEKAKTYLLDEEFFHYDVSSVGLECGFKSKSTFYAIFKKFTGQTPFQFKCENTN